MYFSSGQDSSSSLLNTRKDTKGIKNNKRNQEVYSTTRESNRAFFVQKSSVL